MFRRYGFNVVPRYSSVHPDLTAPNGLNFSKSVGNPNSRLNRVRDYLSKNGPRTKRDILRDVFGKNVGQVSYGWGTYLFGYGIRHGFFTKTRKGNSVLWSVK